MNSSKDTEIRSTDYDNDADEIPLTQKYIQALQDIISETDTNLAALIQGFIDKATFLLQSVTTAGATDQTVIKDLECVINLLASPTPENSVNLHKRIDTHHNAIAVRNNVGIPSAVSGGLIFTGALCTLFVWPLGPLAAVTAVTGLGFFASGTGIAVDAKRKRSTIAEYEQDILQHILLAMINELKWVDFARANLLIIKFDAQSRSNNNNRDNLLDGAIEAICRNPDLESITDALHDLESHLVNNSSGSITATLVNQLTNTLNNLKENKDTFTLK